MPYQRKTPRKVSRSGPALAKAVDAARARAATSGPPEDRKAQARPQGRPAGHPKSGGRQKGTTNTQLDPMTQNLNDILGAVVDAMTPTQFDALSPLDVLLLCQKIAMRAHCFHMTVAVAEKSAPYRHAKLIATQPTGDIERRVIIEGGIGEIKPVPIPVDPALLHEGSDAIN